MHGYHGCYLHVRLDDAFTQRKPLAESVLRRFLGGVGLGTWLLAQESPPGLDPFDPRSPLIFVFSPLVGTPLTTSAKFAVVAKSPLTSRLNDALASSHFALAGKRAGMDALVVTGSCQRPSVLVVDDEQVSVEPAEDLWGLTCSAAEAALQRRFGPRFQFAVIGPAGEKLVRFATISHGTRHAGRGGLGAVMGAKRLKAIAVAGSRRVTLADPEGVVAAARDLSVRSFGPATAKYRELGTLANLLVFNRLAVLPTRNFQASTFEEAEALSVEAPDGSRLPLAEAPDGLRLPLAEGGRVRESCAACTIGCEHIYPSDQGGVRLEYETAYALGPLCGIGDPTVVLGAARFCDEHGLDTISAGATIAFAMECAERGWLDAPNLRFGSGHALLRTLEDIVHRRGLGDRLAEGSRRLAEHLGPDALAIAPQVKGLEMPGYEPRGLQTMALGLAVASRGADHNRSGAYEADFSPQADRFHGSAASAKHAIETEDRAALLDSLILCKFLRGVFADLWSESADLLRLVTGWDVTAEELRTTARRIVTAKKLYNLREGWRPEEDTLPERFFSEPLTNGASAGAKLSRDQLRDMIRAYYRGRAWEEDGGVPRVTIVSLQLEDFPAAV
ncbi:MAG: aldehyde ferredoxin oxidoreductase family protein [Gemmatales bacterium]|nr:aldehyde ferredoxin oxidoreductase family protein [Gemmatales bacterium]MDW8387664.1 aldehyde ferredoxin oxidoreductase family protein [Gemmatales bacterium]